jgi:hypothetical protein
MTEKDLAIRKCFATDEQFLFFLRGRTIAWFSHRERLLIGVSPQDDEFMAWAQLKIANELGYNPAAELRTLGVDGSEIQELLQRTSLFEGPPPNGPPGRDGETLKGGLYDSRLCAKGRVTA